jgi:hypothetical protein
VAQEPFGWCCGFRLPSSGAVRASVESAWWGGFRAVPENPVQDLCRKSMAFEPPVGRSASALELDGT